MIGMSTRAWTNVGDGGVYRGRTRAALGGWFSLGVGAAECGGAQVRDKALR